MKNFKLSEFDCKETGENKMDSRFLTQIDALRFLCGFPFVINSGYRSVNHSKERQKEKGGTHTQGIAADIAVSNGYQRGLIVKHAIKLGFNGIGIHEDFVHVDLRDGPLVIWPYN